MKEENQPIESNSQEMHPKKIVINVERYQHLIEALEDQVKVRRIAVSIFCIGILLFTALTVIMLSLKSFFHTATLVHQHSAQPLLPMSKSKYLIFCSIPQTCGLIPEFM